MKNILTKLVAIMLGGALLLSGCQKELQENVQALQTETAALWAEIKDLKASLESTYATKADLQNVTASLTDVKNSVAALETLVNSKADASAIEAAVAEVEAKLKGLATTENLAALEAVVTALKQQVEGLKNCDCDALEASVEALTANLATLEKTVADYKAATDATLKTIQDEIAKLNSEDFLKELYSYVDTKDAEILAKVLEEVNKAFADAVKTSDLAALSSRISALEGKTSGLSATEVSSMINSALSQYADVNAAINALKDKVADREVVSLVFVPDALVDGVPAVVFNNITYEVDGEELEALETKILRYQVNPSTAVVNPENCELIYSEATEYTTKATSEDGKVFYEEGTLLFATTREDLEGNTVAARVQSGDAYVYSDFAPVYEKTTPVTELVFVNPEVVTISTEATYDVAENVYIDGVNVAAYGFKYVYTTYATTEEGEPVEVEFDGVVSGEDGEGLYAVSVQVVDIYGNVVCETEIAINVVEGVATAQVSVEAERVSFSVSDFENWVEDFMALPNTKETLMTAVEYAMKGDYENAYDKLFGDGVPGFQIQDRTFTVTASSEDLMTPLHAVRMNATLADGFDFDIADLESWVDANYPQFGGIFDNIEDEALEDILDGIMGEIDESDIDLDELIGDIKDAEGIEDIFDILGNEDYAGLVEDLFGVLEDNEVSIEDILGDSFDDLIVDALPEEVEEIFNQIMENEMIQGILGGLGYGDLELEDVIGKVLDVVDLDDLESIIAFISNGGFDEIIDKVEGYINILKTFVGDSLEGVDFDAILEQLENLDINDIINSEIFAEIKDQISDIVDFVQDYIEGFFPDVDDDDVDDDDVDDDITGDDDEDEDEELAGYSEAEKLAIQAAKVKLALEVEEANMEVREALRNSPTWGQIVVILEEMSEQLGYFPQAQEVFNNLMVQIDYYVTWHYENEDLEISIVEDVVTEE